MMHLSFLASVLFFVSLVRTLNTNYCLSKNKVLSIEQLNANVARQVDSQGAHLRNGLFAIQ
jgi:hypothetical protein